MKKISMLFMAAMLSFTVSAQQFANSGFENWSNGKPSGWNSISISLLGFSMDFCDITQTSDAHSGNYAVSIAGKTVENLPQIPGMDLSQFEGAFVPGFLSNAPLNLDLSTIMGLLGGSGDEELDPTTLINLLGSGLPLTEEPLSLNGYLKFDNQEGNDHFLIAALGLAQIDGARQLVSVGVYSDDAEMAKTADYQAFSVPIANMAGVPATEMIVCILTTVEDETAGHFTPLLLDDLTVQYASGLEELDLTSSVSLYPNPTSGEFRIDAPMGSRVSISDALGRKVMEMNSYNGETVRLDNKGVYFVNIDNRLTKKLIVE